MNPRRGGRWWVGAFAIFLALLGVWAIAVWQLYPAGAGPLTLRLGLHSRLQADYGPDQPGLSLAVLRLSIVEDVLRDLGFSGEEAQAQREGVEAAMAAPVPTATARDFQGSAPFTATLVPTATPTETPVPTATPVPTNTRRPTRTPTRTSPPPPPPDTSAPPPTSAPTDTSSPPPTSTPTIVDDHHPEVHSYGYTLAPTPGPVDSCRVTFYINNVHVSDAAVSSGLEWVRFKYVIDPYVPTPQYSADFTLTSGGPVGDRWEGYYSGTLTIEILPGWNATPNLGPDPFHLQLWVRARDYAGHEAVLFLGDYYIPATCDDPS